MQQHPARFADHSEYPQSDGYPEPTTLYGWDVEVKSVISWVYLLVCKEGKVYCGATTNLRKRFREHNSPSNTGWTKNKKWRLLDVKQFESRKLAFDYETYLKQNPYQRQKWIQHAMSRFTKLTKLLNG